MNTQQLIALIDEKITDVTAINGITPVILGGVIKDMVGVLKPYKTLLFRVQISGSTITPTYIINDFSDETITMTIAGSGVLRIAIPSNPIVVNTHLITTHVRQGANIYRLVPGFSSAPGAMDVNIKQLDGTQTFTPNIINQFIEIRIYN